MFSRSKPMETIDPWRVAKFGLRAMIGTIYNGDYQTLLHTKYRSYGPSCFREDFFFSFFPIVSLWDLSVAMETTVLIQSAPKPNALNPLTQ